MLHQRLLREGLGRQVDADASTRGVNAPVRSHSRAWRHASSQHPLVDLRDQADFLGDLEELAGRQQPAFGMLPADQRLDARRPGVSASDTIGWYHTRNSSRSTARRRSVSSRSRSDRRVVQRGVEHRVAAAAGVLGAVHRQVGVADDVLARLVRVGGHGHADAGAGEHVLAVERQRQRGHLLHALGDAHRVDRLADAVEQHRELVAAEAGQRRLGRRRAAVGHARDDVVAAHGARPGARRTSPAAGRRRCGRGCR